MGLILTQRKKPGPLGLGRLVSSGSNRTVGGLHQGPPTGTLAPMALEVGRVSHAHWCRAGPSPFPSFVLVLLLAFQPLRALPAGSV